jgi:hypothetical protein
MPNGPSSYMDPVSMVVIVLTLVLFVVALRQRIHSPTIAGMRSVSGFGKADRNEPQERRDSAESGRASGEYSESAAN